MVRVHVFILTLLLAFSAIFSAAPVTVQVDAHDMGDMGCHGSDCAPVDVACVSHCFAAAALGTDESAPLVSLVVFALAACAALTFVKPINAFVPVPYLSSRDSRQRLTIVKRE